MSVHVEKECELPARGPSSGRESIRWAGGPGKICLGMAVSVWLAWAAQARAQSGEPPDASTGPAATTEPASAASDEPPPLADDSAASASGAADEDAPWNEGVEVDERRAARAVFLEANVLARKRFFASAAAKYRQALELWPHPAFAYNLALAQLQLDQPIEAHASLKRAVAHGPGPLGDRYDQARQQIARIEDELASIEVTCAEPGARVMLDGKLVFTGPGTYRGVVRPGAHQVVAIRSGLSPVVEQAVVSPGEHSRVTLAFEYPETEVIVRKRRWSPWKSYAVVGAGAALVLAGGVLDWHSTSVFDAYDRDFQEACPGPDSCALPPGLDDRRVQTEREQRLALIGYAVGGTALATGAVLAWFGREQSHRERVRMAPDSGTGTAPRAATSSVVPLIAPGIIGVNAGFHF